MTPINVLEDENRHPSGLNGLQRPVKVGRILDFWRDSSHWWLNEAPRDYYLLELETGNVVEVFRAGESWTLSRIAD